MYKLIFIALFKTTSAVSSPITVSVDFDSCAAYANTFILSEQYQIIVDAARKHDADYGSLVCFESDSTPEQMVNFALIKYRETLDE